MTLKSGFCRRDMLAVILGAMAIVFCPLSVRYASAQALPTPSVTGPLSTASPTVFNAGPLGKLDVTGILSGLAIWQDDPALGDEPTHLDISNGQIFLQKTTGVFQFYLQGGAYNIPALGAPYLSTSRTLPDLYGPLPVGFVKIQATKNFSIMVGQLPTLIGAEYTFTFENMNIERGLLWNQENAINRGVQLNDTIGHFTASLSWNDGFYSNRYTWLSGALSYTKGPNTLAFVAGGNAGHTAFRTFATPVQNNGSIYNVIYTYTKGPWIVQPYFQYTDVPTDPAIGVTQGTDTRGGALLLDYNFKHGISLAGRAEYISSTGSGTSGAVNLMFGPGSGGWSVTLTPTYQNKGFFARADLSWDQAVSYTPGDAFGPQGMNRAQARAMVETGFMF
ncbi:MAG TPA: outer membrane beta-barrel protein [Terriglobia bacterium]|nr:outer membrane beta-barrel protein [Terriglobia bacterium]